MKCIRVIIRPLNERLVNMCKNENMKLDGIMCQIALIFVSIHQTLLNVPVSARSNSSLYCPQEGEDSLDDLPISVDEIQHLVQEQSAQKQELTKV